MIDLGIQMLDLAWQLLGQPAPVNVFAVAHQRLKDTSGVQGTFDVEDSAFALLRFEGGKTLELSASWALNQPSRQQGTTCRVHGTLGAVEVYTPHGPTVYRQFGPKGDAKDTPLKLPKVVGYHAMMRHFHACIAQGISPSPSTADGFTVMRMIDGIYKSLQTQRSVEIRNPSDAPERQGFDPIVSTGG
jgi:predicted dehydrogenase